MKPSRFKFIPHNLPMTILVLCVSGIYLYTLAPGLTWANAGSDGGDLLTAAYTGGVAHPTGYPLYLLVARLFQFLPVGSLAFRTNLMSALAMILSVGLIYRLVTQGLASSEVDHSWFAGMVAGFAFGLAPLVWSQAVITEVYALQAFLVLLIFSLYVQPEKDIPASHQKLLDRWRGLVLGLTMGNHVTTFLIVPVVLLVCSLRPQNGLDKRSWLGTWRLNGNSIRRQLTWFSLGLCIYLIIPLRAFAHPPINWGYPITLENFWWLVTGQLYQSYYLQTSLPILYGRIQAFAGLLMQQFGLPGIALGWTGLIMFRMPSQLYILTVWTAISSIAFAIFYSSDDSYVYLIPMIISFAIWIGMGVGNLIGHFAPRPDLIRITISFLFAGYFLIHAMGVMEQVDAAHDLRAETFGREVFAVAPNNALIFTKGDRAVFTLWYFHFALKERPDLVVIAEDLLHFDWYQEVINGTYPLVNIPGPFPWPETIAMANPARPICYVQYIDQSVIDCREPVPSP